MTRKKKVQAPKFIYVKRKKCISRGVPQEILRLYYMRMYLFMGQNV